MLKADRLCALHESFLGDTPGQEAQSLYQVYPLSKGFSDRTNAVDRFEAVFVLALAQTMPMGNSKLHKTMLFVAAPTEGWAVKQMQRIAGVIFGRLKEDGNTIAAKLMGQAFNHLMMGKFVLQVAEEPERWASFGFRVADPVPDWMRKSLLSVEVAT